MDDLLKARVTDPPTDVGGLRALLPSLPRIIDCVDAVADNNARAGFGAAALLAYAERTFPRGADVEDFETVFGDLLGDLRHLADLLDIDFDALLERVTALHYIPETIGEL